MHKFIILSIVLCFLFPCILSAQIHGGPISGGTGLSQTQVLNLFSGANGGEKIGMYTDADGNVDTLAEMLSHVIPNWRLEKTFSVTYATVAPFGLAVSWTDGYAFDADSAENAIV